MQDIYQDALQRMDAALRAFSKMVPQPHRLSFGGNFAYRYTEKSIHQAIVQKLARVVSGLSAATLLLQNGFLQEHGAVQRMLDEFHEDIAFLSFAAIDGVETELHKRYLDEFYAEEIEIPNSPINSLKKRGMIPRQKIRAYINNREEAGPDPSTGNAQLKTIDKAYSGYIHGASPHIMEMYDGNPPRFHTMGMRYSPLFFDHAYDLWNYYYRSILAFGMAAKAFGHETVVSHVMTLLEEFEERSPDRAPLRNRDG